MRSKTINDEELLNSLISIFRTHGYEGASLKLISESVGLKKASLYHRFPKGKEEMALAVVSYVSEIFSSFVLQPLKENTDLDKRIDLSAKRISDFYKYGNNPCIFDSLSLKHNCIALTNAINDAFNFVLNEFKIISMESGMDENNAIKRADKALASIQGSLIICRITGRNDQFKESISELKSVLTEK